MGVGSDGSILPGAGPLRLCIDVGVGGGPAPSPTAIASKSVSIFEYKSCYSIASTQI